MIEFQSLMRAIHKSIRDASKSVEGENIDFINRFFDREKKEDPLDPGKEELILSPKTCTMEFPTRTADGVDVVTAKVPILALCPVSAPRITEVKFTTELDISSSHDNKLMVSFPQAPSKKQEGTDEEQHVPGSKVEITITGGEPPEGLKRLIEGYERALRAQIPG